MATPITPKPAPHPVPAPRPVGVAPQPLRQSKLSTIKRGQLRSTIRHLFYGPEGVGKSSLAADSPLPLFLDVEGGADNLDVARYPFRNEPGGHVPRSYDEVKTAVEDLIANPDHGYETLVIDTVDALEALVHKHLCDTNGEKSIESFGYGKGYNIALDEFRALIKLLDQVRAKGMQVVMLGHAIVKTFKNPEGEDFDRYQLRIHDKAAGLLKEWSDVVGFVHFEGGAAKLKGDDSRSKRARGWATNQRMVQLSREAAWDAKSRLALPATLVLDEAHPWAPFAAAKSGARDASIDSLRVEVTVELDRIGVEEFTTEAGKQTTRTKVLDLVAKSDASTITRILTGLRATAAVSKES